MRRCYGRLSGIASIAWPTLVLIPRDEPLDRSLLYLARDAEAFFLSVELRTYELIVSFGRKPARVREIGFPEPFLLGKCRVHRPAPAIQIEILAVRVVTESRKAAARFGLAFTCTASSHAPIPRSRFVPQPNALIPGYDALGCSRP